VERIEQSGFQGKSEVHLIGLPKLDWYFQGRYRDRAGLLRRWASIRTGGPCCLRQRTSQPACTTERRDLRSDADRYNLIVKLHHYSWMGKYARTGSTGSSSGA